jgi:hypothetical protein
MLFLTPEDLEIQGVFCKEASKIIFQKKILTRFIDFSTQNRRTAIKFCQEFLEDKLFCLIVENQSYLTVWVEEKQVRLTGETETSVNYAQPVSTSLSSQAKDKADALQTQVKSRGFVHPQSSTQSLSPKDEKYSNSNPIKQQGEFDIPLSQSPTEDKASTKKPTKRYRGVSY